MDISRHMNRGGFIKVPDVQATGPRRETIVDITEGNFGPDCLFESGGTLTLNATNMRTMSAAWGYETDEWRGMDVELYIGKTIYNNEPRDSVLVRPLSPPPAQRIPRQKQMDDDIPF